MSAPVRQRLLSLKRCAGCSLTFRPWRRRQRFHSKGCAARWRVRQDPAYFARLQQIGIAANRAQEARRHVQRLARLLRRVPRPEEQAAYALGWQAALWAQKNRQKARRLVVVHA